MWGSEAAKAWRGQCPADALNAGNVLRTLTWGAPACYSRSNCESAATTNTPIVSSKHRSAAIVALNCSELLRTHDLGCSNSGQRQLASWTCAVQSTQKSVSLLRWAQCSARLKVNCALPCTVRFTNAQAGCWPLTVSAPGGPCGPGPARSKQPTSSCHSGASA